MALSERLAPLAALLASCNSGDAGLFAPPPQPSAPVRARVRLELARPVAEVDERFLSVAVDMQQVVGGGIWDESSPPYDFARPRLRRLARELAPAFLRVGGTAADQSYYDLSDAPLARAPWPHFFVFTRAQWDGVHDFARALGYSVLFTLNAGPGSRDGQNRWRPDAVRPLLEYTRARGYAVDLWELGNELNMYQNSHGADRLVTGAQYASDVRAARTLLDEVLPGARLAGPSSAFWPVVGELFPVYPSFLAAGGGTALDVVTWHYYPQQSHRCPVFTRRALAEHSFAPAALDEVSRWAAWVESLAATGAPRAQVWLGETGPAQCGGELGVTDVFASSFWWLDQLGALARRGQRIVVRQTLSGSDYGMLDALTLEPRPDYWASVLWRRLQGPRVLAAEASDAPLLRVYAHCARGVPGGVALLALNLAERSVVTLTLDAPLGPSRERYVVTASSPTSRAVQLNGTPLSAAEDGALPALAPLREDASAELSLAPRSYAFTVFPLANAPACRP